LELMIFLGISFLPILRRCPSYWNLAAVIVLIRSGEASTVLDCTLFSILFPALDHVN
jgi:hypothetical protein